MTTVPTEIPDHDLDPDGRIQVYLSPEAMKEALRMSRQRTRERTRRLLADLLKAIDSQNPDIEHIRALAAGVRFEARLAAGITRELRTTRLGP